MANVLYDPIRERFGDGDVNWDADTIRAVLIDTASYVFSLAHNALADIPAPARVQISPPLTGKDNTLGVHAADDVLLPTVSGATAEALAVYVDSGVEATSWLICYIDSATQLPITPNGNDISIRWFTGPDKIFRI